MASYNANDTKSSSSWLLSCGHQHTLHLLPLLLGDIMRTNPLLEELQTSLLLANPEQLLCSPLIGSKPRHLSDQVSDKLVGFGLQVVLGGLVTLVKTDTNLVPWSHSSLVE